MHSAGVNQVNVPSTSNGPYEADRLACSQAVYEGFQRAEEEVGSINRYYNVAGQTICLRFAGPALVPRLTPAFAHIETEPTATPALTICLWDCVSTHTKMPLLISSLIYLIELRWYETLGPRREVKTCLIPILFFDGA